jgi:hypothetical protein
MPDGVEIRELSGNVELHGFVLVEPSCADFGCYFGLNVRMTGDKVNRSRHDDGRGVRTGDDVLHSPCHDGGIANSVGVLALGVDEVLKIVWLVRIETLLLIGACQACSVAVNGDFHQAGEGGGAYSHDRVLVKPPVQPWHLTDSLKIAVDRGREGNALVEVAAVLEVPEAAAKDDVAAEL